MRVSVIHSFEIERRSIEDSIYDTVDRRLMIMLVGITYRVIMIGMGYGMGMRWTEGFFASC
jgi:hypothetical protein